MDRELRVITANSKVEVRKKDGEPAEIFGYGAVFNSESHVMRSRTGKEFVEIVAPGAFDHLLDDPEIVSLFNHSEDYPLARNKRSMTVGVDEIGFWYKYKAPNSPNGQNITEAIERGDIRGSSFSFITSEKNEKWEMRSGKPALRTIHKFDKVIDLGPVTFEAYPETLVQSRSFKFLDEADNTYKNDLAQMDLDKMRRDRQRVSK